MPGPGDILHYENFVFDDGTIKNKFFIVLHGDPLPHAHNYVSVVTVSQCKAGV
jgi:hypothetical protein